MPVFIYIQIFPLFFHYRISNHAFVFLTCLFLLELPYTYCWFRFLCLFVVLNHVHFTNNLCFGVRWRWALVSLDGVAPSRMVGVSASVNLPLHHKVQKFSSGTGSSGWSQKRAVKRLWWWCGGDLPLISVL